MVVKKQSAGLLVYRQKNGRLEVLLTHPGGPFFVKKDAWGVPKGEYESNEDPTSAARCEFEEEIGQKAPEGELIELGEIKRADGKVIKVWAVEGDVDTSHITSSLFDLEWPPRSGKIQQFPEVDKARWFSLSQTSGKMHKGQEVFIKRLADHLNLPNSTQQSLL